MWLVWTYADTRVCRKLYMLTCLRTQCNIPHDANHKVRDFFRPVEGASYCEMLQSHTLHEWSRDGLTWVVVYSLAETVREAADSVSECTAGSRALTLGECKAYAALPMTLPWANRINPAWGITAWKDRPSGCWHDKTRAVWFNTNSADDTCSLDIKTRPDTAALNDRAECARFAKLCIGSDRY